MKLLRSPGSIHKFFQCLHGDLLHADSVVQSKLVDTPFKFIWYAQIHRYVFFGFWFFGVVANNR
ncbi:Unknown protein sequence [Pseudomonas amygdali pv. sesami]|nr:Unknown protein sequence [Pseudomonas amygdali pv. sesami]